MLATVAAFILVGTTVLPLAAWLLLRAGMRAEVPLDAPALALSLVLAHVAMLRWVEHKPWSELWLGRSAARAALMGQGFLLGSLAIGIPSLALLALGWLERVPGTHGAWWPSAARVTLFLLPAALWEELFVRGYLLRVLKDAWGWRWAIIATSAAFGALHLRNAGADVASVTLVVLAGCFLGAVVMVTESLYAAWMAHVGWNWTMAVLLHTAVSGFPLDAPNYRVIDAGPDWATGGAWGPEGGAFGAVGLLLATTWLLVRRRRRGD
ncbi:MAG: Abortive infection protein [Gemmatimonadetes bacterium]|nr:Abortive infection protein [Gemmatimonadota bacterium]